MIDPFTIKPLDAATIVSSARATGGRIITVEDHYREGTSVCLSPWPLGGALCSNPPRHQVALGRPLGGALCSNPPLPLSPGGLGEAVLSAVGEEPGIMVTRLAVNRIPRSGKPQELLDLYGISAKHIANTVRQTFAN